MSLYCFSNPQKDCDYEQVHMFAHEMLFFNDVSITEKSKCCKLGTAIL